VNAWWKARAVDLAVGSRRLRRWDAGGAAMHITTNRTWGWCGSTLKTARPCQGEPNPAMEATNPITRRQIWGRTGAWDPAVLLLKSDG
jgi:hypothetical protein